MDVLLPLDVPPPSIKSSWRGVDASSSSASSATGSHPRVHAPELARGAAHGGCCVCASMSSCCALSTSDKQTSTGSPDDDVELRLLPRRLSIGTGGRLTFVAAGGREPLGSAGPMSGECRSHAGGEPVPPSLAL